MGSHVGPEGPRGRPPAASGGGGELPLPMGARGCLNAAAVGCALLGTMVLPLYGMLAVLRSDVCDPESGAYYCSGAGQSLGMWIAVACGPVAFVLVGAYVLFTGRGRYAWGYVALGIQFLGWLVVSSLSSMVS
jgi:hypothetical protein